MLENFTTFIKKKGKKEPSDKSKNAAKERLHLVLMQDRANVSADFLEMMKMEIVDVIKKYIDVDETDMDVKLENRVNDDGTSGAPALYANIPIVGINEDKKKESNEIAKAKQVELELEKKAELEKAEKEKKARALKRRTALAKKAEEKETKTKIATKSTATKSTATKSTTAKKTTTVKQTRKVKGEAVVSKKENEENK